MFKKVLSILLVLIWMIMIFGFSNQNSNVSGGLSEKVIVKVVEIFTDIKKDTKEMENVVDKFQFPIRKCAHFFVYFCLGLLVMNALYICDVKNKSLIISVLICIIYATTDEVHQLFISGRSGQLSDVLLDSSASILASYFYHKFIYLGVKRFNEKSSC